jgi:hypothetical protein
MRSRPARRTTLHARFVRSRKRPDAYDARWRVVPAMRNGSFTASRTRSLPTQAHKPRLTQPAGCAVDGAASLAVAVGGAMVIRASRTLQTPQLTGDTSSSGPFATHTRPKKEPRPPRATGLLGHPCADPTRRCWRRNKRPRGAVSSGSGSESGLGRRRPERRRSWRPVRGRRVTHRPLTQGSGHHRCPRTRHPRPPHPLGRRGTPSLRSASLTSSRSYSHRRVGGSATPCSVCPYRPSARWRLGRTGCCGERS